MQATRVRARQRQRWASAIAVSLVLGVGCTHTTPYYRNPAQRWAAWAPDADVAQRLILIGDAGNPDPKGEPALLALKQQVNRIPQRTTVVFLGDNIYERGMPEPAPSPGPVTETAVEVAKVLISDAIQTRKEAERIVNAQVDAVRGNHARAIFIPGNHDWDQFQSSGRERILFLQQYLEQVRATEDVDVQLIPQGGCPGPVNVPLGDRGDVIVLDTQWWIEQRAADKVTPEHNPSNCPYTTERAVHDAMLGMLRDAARSGRRAIVVGHHPLASKGPHSGFVEPLTHLFPAYIAAAYVPVYVEWFPMPIIGSIVVGLRACCSPSVQDMPNGVNKHMRLQVMRPMVEAAREHAAPLAYVAGHDHGLQIFESRVGPPYLIVSGLGTSANASAVGRNRRTLFAHSNRAHPGFMQMDFLTDGRVRLSVIEYAGPDEPPAEVYSQFLVAPEEK